MDVFVRIGSTVIQVDESALTDTGVPDQALVKKQLDRVRAAQKG